MNGSIRQATLATWSWDRFDCSPSQDCFWYEGCHSAEYAHAPKWQTFQTSHGFSIWCEGYIQGTSGRDVEHVKQDLEGGRLTLPKATVCRVRWENINCTKEAECRRFEECQSAAYPFKPTLNLFAWSQGLALWCETFLDLQKGESTHGQGQEIQGQEEAQEASSSPSEARPVGQPA